MSEEQLREALNATLQEFNDLTFYSDSCNFNYESMHALCNTHTISMTPDGKIEIAALSGDIWRV